MPTTFDVRVWKTEKYVGKRAVTYVVRWGVAGRPRKRRFPTAALADGYRSSLVTALRQGEPFDVASGRPVSALVREANRVSWYAFACEYVDMKWPSISPKHRKGIAEALSTVTVAMLTVAVDESTAKLVRSALLNWAFNQRRGSAQQPQDVTEVLAWVETHCRLLVTLQEPALMRSVLETAATKVDGTRASARTAAWKRSILSTALGYAVERGLLESNPVGAVAWKAPRSVGRVDRRVVANPTQARTLLAAVRATPSSGHLLVGFFACMYYSALRPEEVVGLRVGNLDLPAQGWGWITLDGAAAEVDRQWTDSGRRRDERALKHRPVGETRRVPCPPELTAILHQHLDSVGPGPDGRVFRGSRGGPVASATYTRLWSRARRAALSPEQADSPLARRPYDLRHAAVSTWLNGGVPPTQVAEWAGHSVEILLKIYAKCLDGGQAALRQKIERALGLISSAE